jgi:hypothetical protein
MIFVAYLKEQLWIDNTTVQIPPAPFANQYFFHSTTSLCMMEKTGKKTLSQQPKEEQEGRLGFPSQFPTLPYP